MHMTSQTASSHRFTLELESEQVRASALHSSLLNIIRMALMHYIC